jgi:outer membrane lipoprotein-sorting protein
MKKVLLAAGILLVSISSAFSQTADEVIAKYVDAIGGKQKWNSLNSLRVEGQIEVQGISIPFTMNAVQNKGNRTDAEFQGAKIIEIVTPTAGWSLNGLQGQSALQPMSEEDLKSKVDGIEIQDQLVDYAAKGHTVELLGKDEADGNEYFKLKVVTKLGNEKVHFIDTKSYLIYKTETTNKANGQEVKQEVKFLDYQTMENGIKMAFKQETGAMILVFKKISINPVIDESLFKGN